MSSNRAPASSTRLEYLDGVRGLGALIVVLCHYRGLFAVLAGLQYPIWGMPPFMLLIDGRFAVFIFFVLSGFVLSQSAAKGKSTFSARLVARYLRLTVPMLASLLYAWALYALFPASRVDLQKIEPTNPWLLTIDKQILPNFVGAFQDGLYRVYATGYSQLNGVVWTMRKELLGSVAIYVLYRFCPKPFYLAAIGVFAAITLYSPIYLGFPIGAFLREIWHRGWLHDRKWFSLLALGLSIYLACEWGSYQIAPVNGTSQAASSTEYRQNIFYAFSAGLLIYSALTNGTLRWMLHTPAPQFLGRISFALYLVHYPLLLTVMPWLFIHLAMPLDSKLLFLFVVFLTVSLSIAWMLTVGLDEPLMKRLHQLKKLDFLSMMGRKPDQN